MIETLLVAVGDSDRERIEEFREQVERMAEEGTTVVLFHAFDPDTYLDLAKEAGLNTYSGDTATVLAREYEPIADLREALPEDVEVRIEGSSGDDPVTAILRAARSVGADGIVLGGRRRSAVGKATFGSTAQKVMMRADQPVTFVRKDTGSPLRTLKNAL